MTRSWTTALRRLLLLLGSVGAAVLIGSAASAFWTESGDGDGAALTGSLLTPTSVMAGTTVNTNYVTLSWSPAASTSGVQATGYVVVRVDESDQTVDPACGSSDSSPVTTSSCTDAGVTDGDYHYLVTARLGGWTALGSPSNSVSVVNDNSAPTASVTSISPAPNGNGYNSSSPVTVTVTAHAGFGVASISYQLDGGSTVTVPGSSASVSVAGQGTHSLSYSAQDNNGTVSATKTQIVRIDTAPPAAPSAPVLTAASDSGTSNSDGVTNATTPTVTGTAEASATVRVLDGATLVGSGTATASGTYSITLSTLAQGSHTLTATATDLAGNLGPASSSTTIVVDTTAPTAPAAPTLAAASDSGVSSSDRITNVTLSTYTGTAEPGATVSLYNSTTKVGSTTSAADGSYSVTATTAITSGTRTITVKVVDLAGNTSSSSPATTVYVDTTVPTVKFTGITAASDSGRSTTDRVTNVTTPTTYGTVTANTATPTNPNNYLSVLDAGTTSVGALTTSASSWSINTTTLTDAAHSVTVRATDAAGNQTTTTALTITVDTVAPVAPGTPVLATASDSGRSTSDRITNKTTPVITGTNEKSAIVVLYDAGATSLGTVTASSSATTSSITSAALADGVHGLTETQTDIAGNTSPASASTSVTIDTVAPDAPSVPLLATASDTGVSSSDGITRNTSLVFTGTAEVNANVQLYDSATASGSVNTATSGSYSATTGTLAAGVHTVSAKAIDVAGNTSAASGTTSVTVDTAAPAVTVNQSTDQVDPTTTASVTFTVTFSEPVYGFDGSDVTLSGTALATTAVVSGAGPTYTVTVSGMSKSGTVVATVAAGKVTDTAGNNNAASTATDNSVTYTDNVAPAAPSAPVLAAASDTGVSATDGITKVTTPIFTGTAEAGATVRLYAGSTLVGTTTAVGGSWSITSSTLAQGTYAITAAATDPSGNVGPASTASSLTVDTTSPSATINQATGQSDPTSGTSVSFTATFSEPVAGFDGADVTLGGTAGATTATVSGSGASYTVTVSGMVRTGSVTATIGAGKVTDVAGNNNLASSSTDNTVTYNDTAAPTVLISSFSPSAGQTASVAGTAGTAAGDNLTVTIVLCTVNVFPCAAGNIKATLSGVPVSAADGTWSVTSSSLGTTSQLYARATQTDQTGNSGTSGVSGPIAIP